MNMFNRFVKFNRSRFVSTCNFCPNALRASGLVCVLEESQVRVQRTDCSRELVELNAYHLDRRNQSPERPLPFCVYSFTIFFRQRFV